MCRCVCDVVYVVDVVCDVCDVVCGVACTKRHQLCIENVLAFKKWWKKVEFLKAVKIK